MNQVYIPNHIPEYFIYDILHNDNNELIIVIPAEFPLLNIEYLDNGNRVKFIVNTCLHNHTYVYELQTNYKKDITLIINGNVVNTYVNKYPTFPNEIIFSTLVKNEDKYIVQWIEYHSKIGVSRFIIYDNSDDTTSLNEVLKTYIEENKVILFKWSYPFYLRNSGYSAQTTQQTHCNHAFNNSKYIGMFDVDEYINIQKPIKLNDMLEIIIQENNVNVKNISCFRLLNKFFYNPYNLPTDDYNFLKIYNCDKISKTGQEKCIVIPKNSNVISIHFVSNGLQIYEVDEKYIFFNHYYFLNKTSRGRNKTDLIDDSIKMHIT